MTGDPDTIRAKLDAARAEYGDAVPLAAAREAIFAEALALHHLLATHEEEHAMARPMRGARQGAGRGAEPRAMPRTYQALGYHGEAMTPPLPFDVGLVMQVQQRVLPGRSLMELLAARGRLGALLRHTRRCGRCGAGICATAACLAKDVLGRPRCRKRKPR